MDLKYIKYQSSLPLINRVKDTLHSYDAAGLIDDSQFYDWIKLEMQSLGLGYYQDAEVILDVNKFRASVPADFVNLYSVMRCTYRGSDKVDEYIVDTPVTVNYMESCISDVLKKPCSGFEYVGKVIRFKEHVHIQFPRYKEYESKGFLKWTNRVGKEHLCNECVNLTTDSKDEFSLDENFFYFNFTDDSVHLRYYKLAVDEDGLPLVPDIASVKNAIEKYIIYRLFQQWWYNNEVDVQQRMGFSEQEYNRHHSNAIKEVKMPSYHGMMEYAERKHKKSNPFMMNSPAIKKLK